MVKTPCKKHASKRPRVIIIGGGFAGLEAAHSLRSSPVDITLLDRTNHHLFQPLLYQVATGSLSPANIAAPLRGVLRKQKNCAVRLAEVSGFDLERQTVHFTGGCLSYDTLIVATGATHSYFGKPEWAEYAPGLKTIENALEMRRRILLAFERAEWQEDPQEAKALKTFVIVGAGPTGVELAGELAELARHTLRKDFRRTRSQEARVILLDAGDRILPGYREHLAARAEADLKQLGVEIKVESRVTAIDEYSVTVADSATEYRLSTRCVLWAAGVRALPLGRALGDAANAYIDSAGRVAVTEQLTLPGFDNIYIIGDLALCRGSDGLPLPGLAPVAIQQAQYAAARINSQVKGRSPVAAFEYRDRGKLATVGRGAAIAELGKFSFAGLSAWLVWLLVHLMQIVEFQNRALVLLQWGWSYLTWSRAARLITRSDITVGEANSPNA